MIERLVSEVPERIWQVATARKGRVREEQFNVASWVRFHNSGGQLKLLIHYEDESGEHVTPVDGVSAPGDGTALLSGVVKLRFTGRVQAVRVLLGVSDSETSWSVDELYMQRRGEAMTRQHKLIAGF